MKDTATVIESICDADLGLHTIREVYTVGDVIMIYVGHRRMEIKKEKTAMQAANQS